MLANRARKRATADVFAQQSRSGVRRGAHARFRAPHEPISRDEMRRASTTPEERQQVFELVDEHGLSDREVAAIVFGDARYHDRVRRLLARRARAVELPPSPPP